MHNTHQICPIPISLEQAGPCVTCLAWRPCEEPIDESKPLGCPALKVLQELETCWIPSRRRKVSTATLRTQFEDVTRRDKTWQDVARGDTSNTPQSPRFPRHKSLWLDEVHDRAGWKQRTSGGINVTRSETCRIW